MVQRRREGFTIIEILVVVGIIAVLVGLLLPALSGARKNSLKKTELNFLRQVGMGWQVYANSYDDAALPGYIEPEVQTRWDVEWESSQRRVIDQDDAAPYTWRLMPYLDFSAEVFSFYDDTWELDFTADEHVAHFARYPAFGYNGHYIGGWWQEVAVSGNVVAKYSFFDAEVVGSPGHPANAVATRVTQIRRPSEVLTFCSATQAATPGILKSRDMVTGWHIAHAPASGERERWTSFGAASGAGGIQQGIATGSLYEVDVIARAGVPLGRYTKLAAVLFGDGHTNVQTAGALTDMRFWVPSADDPGFRHTDGSLPAPP